MVEATERCGAVGLLVGEKILSITDGDSVGPGVRSNLRRQRFFRGLCARALLLSPALIRVTASDERHLASKTEIEMACPGVLLNACLLKSCVRIL